MRSLRAGTWVVLALVLGLASGFGEVAFQAARHYLLSHWVRLSPHAAWMIPLVQTVLLGAMGMLAAIAWRIRPSRRTALLGSGVLAGLAILPVILAQPYIDRRAAALVAIGIAVQAARLAVRWLEPLMRLARRALPVLVLLFLVTAAGVPLVLSWRERQLLSKHAAPTGRPNILLIILDTVRAASLSGYGYARATAPFLERFAREGARFERAYSTSPWTLPSHASAFTGRWPHELSADWNSPLDDRFPTLAEWFSGAGYATGAFVANDVYTMPETGLDRGFIRYRAFRLTPAELIASSAVGSWLSDRKWVRRLVGSQDILNRKRAQHVNGEFLRWASKLGGRPYFAVLNIFDAHEPYLPPAPYDTLFGDGRIGFHPKTTFTPRSVALGEDDRKRLPPDEVARQHTAYDGSIRSIDAQLERLMDSLRTSGLLDRTVVVITADHGEGLGEGGEFMHGNLFSDLTTHVPLLVRYPALVPAGSVIGREVSLRDLAATLVDLAGLSRLVDSVPGASLTQLLSGGAESKPISPPFASFWAWTPAGTRRWSLIRGDLRYLKDDKNKTEAAYDLRNDPYETANLLPNAAPSLRDNIRLMRGVIDSIRAETGLSPRPNPWKPQQKSR